MSGNNAGIRSRKIFNVIGNIIFTVILLIIILALFSTILTRIKGEEPSLFGYKLYYAASGSMTPTIPVGSLIIVKETDINGIQNSDIITFKGSGNTVVTHRVVEISNEKRSFTTRGDANNTNDPLPVISGNLIGKVVVHAAYIGYLLEFLKTKYGLVVSIAVITFMIILSLLPKQKENKIRKFKGDY